MRMRRSKRRSMTRSVRRFVRRNVKRSISTSARKESTHHFGDIERDQTYDHAETESMEKPYSEILGGRGECSADESPESCSGKSFLSSKLVTNPTLSESAKSC